MTLKTPEKIVFHHFWKHTKFKGKNISENLFSLILIIWFLVSNNTYRFLSLKNCSYMIKHKFLQLDITTITILTIKSPTVQKG